MSKTSKKNDTEEKEKIPEFSIQLDYVGFDSKGKVMPYRDIPSEMLHKKKKPIWLPCLYHYNEFLSVIYVNVAGPGKKEREGFLTSSMLSRFRNYSYPVPVMIAGGNKGMVTTITVDMIDDGRGDPIVTPIYRTLDGVTINLTQIPFN